MRYILALDPLVSAGVGAKQVLIVAIKVVVAFVVMLVFVVGLSAIALRLLKRGVGLRS